MSLTHSHPFWIPHTLTEPEALHRDAASWLADIHRLAGETSPPRPVADGTRLSLDESYRHCVEMIRTNSKSFFFSSQLLPPEKRLAVRAFYAFCRTSDDTVDNAISHPAQALSHWVGKVYAPHAPADDAVLLAWKDTAARFNVPQMLVDELLAGIAMDLTVNRYATFGDLWLYCYRVASVVGLISMEIIGYREGASAYAVKLGVALQLTNILRDVGEDAARGRVYLPLEDLERFGLTDDDIINGQRDERFRALMRFEIKRAHALYDASWPGITMLHPDGQLSIAAAGNIYRGILGKIVANDYDVYNRRAHVPLPEKLTILSTVWRRLRREQGRT